ncbi:hypothetical protein [Noviherbaspirillum aerium]|uniref:hypothetical protein n=1 Tax=Noviherbaspirillum aerium TaxID=2588497 RepID=UPI00124C96BF|nr:hypothetical protein [Noviherbaspirillum aerium]
MRKPRKSKSPRLEGLKPTKLAGGVGTNKNVVDCSANTISKVVKELYDNGFVLLHSSGEAQFSTLPKALAYRGDRGLNTYEAMAAEFAQLATHFQDLEADGWLIDSLRVNVIGPGELSHANVARYVLVGRRVDLAAPQGTLDLGCA